MLTFDIFKELCKKYGLKTDIFTVQVDDYYGKALIAFGNESTALMCMTIKTEQPNNVFIFDGKGTKCWTVTEIEKELLIEMYNRKRNLIKDKKLKILDDFT
jgi:hypothetical protein